MFAKSRSTKQTANGLASALSRCLSVPLVTIFERPFLFAFLEARFAPTSLDVQGPVQEASSATPASCWYSWSLNRNDAASTFSSRCLTDEVPGMGSITGERFSNQASATCLGVLR